MNLAALSLVVLGFLGPALAQSCIPKSGILQLARVDTCRDSIAILECLGKIQLSTSEFCSVAIQPDIRVAMDGTFCEPSQGVERGTVFGKLNLGFSHLQFEFKNSGTPGMVGMHLNGRLVPPEGGMEKQIDCNMHFNVTAGTALGVVSQGSDSMASAIYSGGGYTGATQAPGQQQPAASAPPRSSATSTAAVTLASAGLSLLGLLAAALW